MYSSTLFHKCHRGKTKEIDASGKNPFSTFPIDFYLLELEMKNCNVFHEILYFLKVILTKTFKHLTQT